MKEKILIVFLKGIACIPLGLLYLFSDFVAFMLYYIIKYRRKVVRANLESSFPEKGVKEIKRLEKEFYLHLSDQIVETLKLFHVSDDELKKRVKVNNYEAVNQTLGEGKNAVLLMGHYGNWEWAQEITRYFLPESYMASIYQPLQSKTWDNIFLKMRSRWGAHILPSKQTVHALLNRDNFPWVCGFIADQRPGIKTEKNWVDFLHHKTYFFYLTEDLGRKVDADFFYLEMERKKRGYYEIVFHPLKPSQSYENYPHVREFWKEFENTIKSNPAYWLWSHKRWK